MRGVTTLLPTLLATLLLFVTKPGEGRSRAMTRYERAYGKLNPHAPPELSRFAFLIGAWRCEARLKQDDGTSQALKGSWEGRYVLDGYAIEDEFRMMTPAGELMVLGVNLRAYDAQKKTWNMKWLNALAGTWTDLGPQELGGVTADDKAISYTLKEPVAHHAFTRATYTNFSSDHFTWRGERSNDGKTWEELLIIEVYRQ